MTQFEAHELVIDTLEVHGFEAYLVGGCVRDLILGRNPKDFDVTTNARPEQVQAIFAKTLAVGAAFGVVIVMINDIQIEVATYRTDGQYSDGRRPDEVSYSTDAREDVRRRDFTMNALLMTKDEKIVDYVNGKNDIDSNLIRCVGKAEERFREDPVRMLRAVRFAAQLNFDIEPETFRAIQKLAHLLERVSRERVALELQKLVTADFPVKGLVLLLTSGLVEYVFPSTLTMKYDQILKRFTNHLTKDANKGLAQLLVDCHPTMAVANTLKSLKLPNEQTDTVMGAVTTAETLKLNNTVAGYIRLARRPGFFIGLDLFEQNGGDAKLIEFFRALTPEQISPAPFVTGQDLIDLGHTPGPEFKHILTAVENAQLEGRIRSREEALEVLNAGPTIC